MIIKSYKSTCIAILAALSVVSFTACKDRAIEESADTDYDELEQEVFDEWMALNRADNTILLNSQQTEGYYIEFAADSNPTGESVQQGEYVQYNITTCDLDGNICHTRNESMAVQQGTYNRVTRYVPMTDYIPLMSDYSDYDEDELEDVGFEAIHYAFMSDEMNINGEAVKSSDLFKAGSKFTLYYTSALAGTANGAGGYAGQYSHSGYRPLVSEIEIIEVINVQSTYEKNLIDEFATLNSDLYNPITDWVLLNDEEAHYIRLNTNYMPSTTDLDLLKFVDAYPYSKMLRDNTYKLEGEPTTLNEMNIAINTEILDLYEEDGLDFLVGSESDCYIWYIARTLDGFIVDSNIQEVQEIIYGSAISSTTYIGYNAEDDEDNYISAWYHVVPKLAYGSWAAFLTTSTNAYGAAGSVGSSSTTEIPPYTPLLFEVYVEDIYDDSYYYYYD